MKTLNKTLIILSSTFLIGCGSSKSVNFSTDPSQNINDPNAKLAYCNVFVSPNINGKIKAYTNPYGEMASDTVEITFDNLPASLANGYTLKFYKWFVRPDGSTYIHPTAIPLMIKDLHSGQMVTGKWTEISQTMVDEFATYNYGQTGMTLQQFLNGRSIVVSGIEIEYDVIRASFQDGSSQFLSIDALVPAFSANPAKYAASHSPILQALHPNNSVAVQAWSDEMFQQRTQSYCF